MQIGKLIRINVQLGTLFVLFYFTMINVERRWSEADVLLAFFIPIIGLISIICLVGRRVRWQWTCIDAMAALWMLYFLFRVWFGGEYPCGTLFLQIIWMCFLFVVLRIVFVDCEIHILWFSAYLILFFGAVESIWGISQIVEGKSRHGLYLLSGNFLTPGLYSAYPMMGAVVGLVLLTSNIIENEKQGFGKYIRKVVVVLTGICLIILPATCSRSAWVGVGIVSLWLFRRKYWNWRWYVWGGLIILFVFVFFVKHGSAEGRMIIWAASLVSWWESPLFGVGLGGFCHAVSEGISILYNNNNWLSFFYNAGVTEYSYNFLIQILVEQGAFGMLLGLMTILFALKQLHEVCLPLMYCLIALLIFSCFSYPFERLPYRIIFVLIISMASSHNMREKKQYSKWILVLLGCVVIVFSYLLVDETKGRLENDEDIQLIIKRQDPHYLKTIMTLLPQNMDNSDALFYVAKMMHEKGRWRDSNAFLRMGTEVSMDPIFYVLQGNNYQEMGFDDLAEEAYLKAFSIMPNRHYPLYQLMLLYDKTQQDEKAIEMAKRIINMKPKVKSPATDEMQQKAKEYLNRI